MYQAIFFDIDDTIFSYARCGRNALEKTFQVCGFPYSDEAHAFFRQVDEALWSRQKEGLLTIDQVLTARADAMATRFHKPEQSPLFQATFLQKLGEEVETEPFARETLAWLGERVILCGASNGVYEIQRARLEKAGLLSHFTHLFVSDAVGAEKPDPSFFQVCLKTCALPPEQVLMVGDSLQADMAGAEAAGLDRCWYNPKRLPPDSRYPVTYEIMDLREVCDLLNGESP